MITRLRSPRHFWLGLALLVVMVGSLIMVSRPKRNEWIALDRTKVTLQKVTFGKRHEHVSGGPLAQVQRQLARIPFSARLGIKSPVVRAQNRSDDCATLWFLVESPTNNATPLCEVWIVEEATGLAARATAVSNFPLEKGQTLLAATFENYPRRAPELMAQFIIWQMGPTNNWFSHRFRTPNPTRPTTGTLRAQSGAGQPANGVTFALDRVITGLAIPGAVNPPHETLRPYSQADFSIREHGAPSTNWIPSRVEAVSATANKLAATGSSHPGANGVAKLLFPEAMWPAESPWQIRAEFTRIGNFAPEELWRYRMADVRSVLEQGALNLQGGAPGVATNVILGCRVTIIALRSGSQPGQGLELSVRMDGAPDDINLSLVSARDASGQELPRREVAFSRGNGMMIKVLGLGPPVPIGSLDLVLAVHKNRHAEFTVTPELVDDKKAATMIRPPERGAATRGD